MTPGRAEEIAADALLWLCAQEALLPVFLAATGASAADLRDGLQAGGDPALGGAALDFILMRDETVIAASGALGLAFDQLALAQAVLSGAGQMHWT
ncbi:DUF3572 family protein [Natronohydrobacter thiooxidans]|jgi:hypothetical protein|uniref:DUF3572 family protein n=1 Tax=Natronohydrobacter thiooxidans TaxID=87172 RepID=UPI0008FF6FFB|nr:DUF3572 family protein [Natronohydrobacter thiooxidans]